MKISPTLSRYLAKHYAISFVTLMVGLMALVYFLDVIELLRRGSKFDDVTVPLILKMGLFKLPEVTQILLPFAVLFSAIYTFWNLTQKLELIIVRASGFSAFHFLLPITAVAFAIGILNMAAFNPLGALMVKQYERMENTHLKRRKSSVTLFEDGLWLHQDMADGYAIIHSPKIESKDWSLNNVTGLFLNNRHEFLMRLDAQQGRLENGQWLFKDATLHHGFDQKAEQKDYALPTDLTSEEIIDSFASPETLSFWSIPNHINTLRNNGFDPSKLIVHFHTLMAQPILLSAMILIAAGVAMRLPRSGSSFKFILAGLFVGLALFFMSSFMQALGASQQVPAILASWAPACLSLLIGLSLILHIEEE